MLCFQELYCIFTYCTYFADYVDGKHITEIGAVGGCDVDMIDDMVGIMKRQNLLVDGDCLRLGSDVGKGNGISFAIVKSTELCVSI